MKLSEWKEWVMGMYGELPDTYKKSPHLRNIYRNVAADVNMIKCLAKDDNVVVELIEELCEFTEKPNACNEQRLTECLDTYYSRNENTIEIEKAIFRRYKNKPMMPMFVLSYGRWGKNATLEFLEKVDSQEIYDNTFVFVNSEQEEQYKNGHPKFNYYSVDVSSVGERMAEVLKFCKKWGLDRVFVMEDDIITFNYAIKCSTVKCRCNKREEPIDANFFKRIQYTADEIMNEDKRCSMVRIRNRFHINSEESSIAGYEDIATIGGTPDLCWMLDVKRFSRIYKQIPPQHYSPQYDWAMLCAMLKNRSTWYVLTGVCKDELMGNSVINDSSDRTALAEQMISYYGVEDMIGAIVIKSKRQSIKLRCKRKNGRVVNYED